MTTSGMDLFGTAGIRGGVDTRVTPERCLAVGRAVGSDAREAGDDRVVLARDGRVTGPGLAAAVEAGLVSAGVDVLRAGRLPTPALAFASVGGRGVMLTASHNPPADNGIKLFEDGREYDESAEGRIEARVAAEPAPTAWDGWGSTGRLDVITDYRSAVVDYAAGVGAPLEGCPIAVDCGNGTGADATPDVLRALGADVTALNASVDGHFPARPSKPTAETLGDLRAFVAAGPQALGFAHDGDADRIVVIDGAGEVVHEDTVVAVLAEHYVRATEAAEPVVVTTPNASARIDERVAAAGGETTRVRLGALHEGVAASRAHGRDVVFAAEPWKHLHPGLGGWIDGVASAAVLARLVAAAGGLAPLVEPVAEPPARKASVPCPDERKPAAMTAITEDLPGRLPDGRVDTAHGVRVDGPDGWWVLVRPSGTEPVIRIYAEGDPVDDLLATARAAVEAAVTTA